MIIIDRFEGDFAVAETEQGMMNILTVELPEDAKEGDVIYYENGVYLIDRKETENRRKLMAEKLHRLTRYKND